MEAVVLAEVQTHASTMVINMGKIMWGESLHDRSIL